MVLLFQDFQEQYVWDPLLMQQDLKNPDSFTCYKLQDPVGYEEAFVGANWTYRMSSKRDEWEWLLV